jgi:hypothetical protein
MPSSSIARPSKIYPNLDFWFENPDFHLHSHQRDIVDQTETALRHCSIKTSFRILTNLG